MTFLLRFLLPVVVLATITVVAWTAFKPDSALSPQSSQSQQQTITLVAQTTGETAADTLSVQSQAEALLVTLSSPQTPPEQRLALIDPELQSITPVEYIDRLELAGPVSEIEPNYFSAPGRIYLVGDPNPVEGNLFFTQVGGKLVLTSDRSR